MLTFVGNLFDSWLSEVATLAWLALALVGAIVEVSIPHFGFAFVSAGAVAAAVAAYFGFGIIPQIGIFVVVLVVSLIGLRSRLVGYLGGQGVPSRQPALGAGRRHARHRRDARIGPRQRRRRGLGRASARADCYWYQSVSSAPTASHWRSLR